MRVRAVPTDTSPSKIAAGAELLAVKPPCDAGRGRVGVCDGHDGRGAGGGGVHLAGKHEQGGQHRAHDV